MYALDFALEKILDEGMSNIFKRQIEIGQMTRTGLKDLGLSLLPEERFASNTVTAVKVPNGVNAKILLEKLRTDYDVILAGGYGALAGKKFRIGHMGYVTTEEIQTVLDALADVLPKLT